MYRLAEYEREKRKDKKNNAKNNWFKNKNPNFKSVMFVEPTPNSGVVKLLRHAEEQHKMSENKRIKFVEKAGVKLVHKLLRKIHLEETVMMNIVCHVEVVLTKNILIAKRTMLVTI